MPDDDPIACLRSVLIGGLGVLVVGAGVAFVLIVLISLAHALLTAAGAF